MKPKYLVIIILAILASGAGYIYLSRQPVPDLGPITVHRQSKQASSIPSTDVKDWKTYTNSQYGFEFKYPEDYKINENINKDVGFYVTITTPKTLSIINDTGGEDGDAILIVPSEINPGYFSGSILPSPVEFTGDYFKSKKVANYSNEYLGQLNISGRIAFQLRHSELTTEKYTILKNKDGTFFTVAQDYITASDSSQNVIEPYDTIILTFKFAK